MNTTLQLLAGDEAQFARGLVDLGWFDYAPTLTNEPLMAAARRSLKPSFRSAGEVVGAGASVYRLTLDSHRWQDAVKVAESQLNRRPHFAVVFVTLPRAVMIVVPEDPEKARTQKSGIRTAQIFLDITRHDKHADEVIKRLKAAKRDGFRKKLQDSADIKRVTDGFYKAFDKQKDAFIEFIEEVGSLENKQWYASVLLNRLMFLYFIQSNGLMAPGYLRAKLEMNHSSNAAKLIPGTISPPHLASPAIARSSRGEEPLRPNDNYYRDFLCPLFFDGLAVEQNKRTGSVKTLLGDVPYLNGGLFMPHKLENEHPTIAIADEAFYGLFKLFDEYTWYIDDRPIARDRELNPDVLGYIFEKYVNQKQMGAYYTKEDITGYICRNTIIPRLFDMLAEARGQDEFRLPIAEIEPYIWDAVKHGVSEPLPDYIESGIATVSLRTRWNEPAPASHALPTETWRELIARRQRYASVHADFMGGKITTANDFITYNLNLPLAALDLLHQCTDASILSDLYFNCLQRITGLDPTCGSGAFLFAALNILYPLYEACLDRMEELKSADRVEDRPMLTMKGEFDFANEVDAQQTFMDPDFDPYTVTVAILERCQAELDRIADQRHPNRSYYIHKTIIVNNLYGVDIMEEAVEICKLRLFLNLISHADPDASKENLGIEPLPDIDFNILAGNTLVGYTTIADIDRQWHAVEVEKSTFAFEKDHSKLGMLVTEYGHKVDLFRKQQLGEQLDMPVQTKQDVLRACSLVQPGLDEDLWRLYRTAGKLPDKTTLKKFIASHEPFHWFLQFPQVMAGGGFDVVVGNPPYVEYSKVRTRYQVVGFEAESSGNLYASVLERSLNVASRFGRCGLIVPVSFLCTERTIPLQELAFSRSSIWASSYASRPSTLFTGVTQRLTIALMRKHDASDTSIFSGGYHRWNDDERATLLSLVEYVEFRHRSIEPGYIPKVGAYIEKAIWSKISRQTIADHETTKNEAPLYIHRIIQYFVKAVDFVPYFWNEKEGVKKSEDYKPFYFDPGLMYALAAIINSSVFYWYWHTFSDGFHCGYRDVRSFAVNDLRRSPNLPALNDAGRELMVQLRQSTSRRVIFSKSLGRAEYDEFDPRECQSIVSRIDQLLAVHYGFTPEESDYIANYIHKYRIGKDSEEAEL